MNEKYQLTKEGLEALKVELDQLNNVDRPRNIEALSDARAQGDLSENADYDAARNEQARIEARIQEVQYILSNHVIIDGKAMNNLGKKVTVKYLNNGKVDSYNIVGSLEASPKEHKISDESPLGKAVLDAKIGDVVVVNTKSKDNVTGIEFSVEVLDIA